MSVNLKDILDKKLAAQKKLSDIQNVCTSDQEELIQAQKDLEEIERSWQKNFPEGSQFRNPTTGTIYTKKHGKIIEENPIDWSQIPSLPLSIPNTPPQTYVPSTTNARQVILIPERLAAHFYSKLKGTVVAANSNLSFIFTALINLVLLCLIGILVYFVWTKLGNSTPVVPKETGALHVELIRDASNQAESVKVAKFLAENRDIVEKLKAENAEWRVHDKGLKEVSPYLEAVSKAGGTPVIVIEEKETGSIKRVEPLLTTSDEVVQAIKKVRGEK